MSKRKEDSDNLSDDGSTIDVDFEWFDPAEVDYHGIKQLLKQLFDVDHELHDLGALADLILKNPQLGSVVKVPDDAVEAKDNDPFVFLTLLDLETGEDIPALRDLTSYLRRSAAKIPALAPKLAALLPPKATAASGSEGESPRVALLLSERFINIPSEVMPPTYRFLLDELKQAASDEDPYPFTHILVLSKTYREITADDDKDRKKKRRRGDSGANGGPDVKGPALFFHPEDEILIQHASGHGEFEYEREAQAQDGDARQAFKEAGVRPAGEMILIESDRFEGAVDGVAGALKAPTG